MEKDLMQIRHLDKDSDESLFSELYRAGARFQPDNNKPGEYSVIWENTLDQLAGSQAIAAELALKGISKISSHSSGPKEEF